MDDSQKEKKIDALIGAIDKAYHHLGWLMWRGFLIGLMSGLGATIGVAITLAILGFFVRQLGGLPVIGDWFLQLNDALPGRR